MKTTTISVILEHMQRGKEITSMAAIRLYSITRLADVIFRLTKKGYEIERKTITVATKYSDKQPITKYWMNHKSPIK